MIKSFKTAAEIVKASASLTGADFTPTGLLLLDDSIETGRQYKTLLLKSVDEVLQDYFANFPMQLQTVGSFRRVAEDFLGNGYFFALPEDLYSICSIIDKNNINTVLRKETSLANYLVSTDACYYEEVGSFRAKNTSEEILIHYISKAVFCDDIFAENRSLELEGDNKYILLDSLLLTYSIARDYCLLEGEIASKTQYFAVEYKKRLDYLINEANTDNNFVFDLNTNSMRRARA